MNFTSSMQKPTTLGTLRRIQTLKIRNRHAHQTITLNIRRSRQTD